MVPIDITASPIQANTGEDNWGLSAKAPINRSERWRLHTVTAVSCIRLAGAPLFVFLFLSTVVSERAASLPFLLLLFLTDVVDGFLARRWNVATNFGYILDGVADRSAHIGVIMALTARHELSPVLGFLLIFRDIILYASRALFGTWWNSNAGFRLQVRLAAVVFKLTVGVIALLSYIGDAAPQVLSEDLRRSTLWFFHMATWAFAVWSYTLLARQIHCYASDPTDARGSRW